MVEVVWTQKSLDDISQIANYISKDSFNYASRVVDRILSAGIIIHHQLNAGRIVPEFKNKNIREIIIGNYRVVYRVSSKKAEILTVHHGVRKMTKRRLQ